MLDKSDTGARMLRHASAGKAANMALVAMSLALSISANAQDQGVPFKVQPVGDQVVNGVLVRGARVPVWADTGGRTPGRAPSAATERNQDELNELARIGRPDSRGADNRAPSMVQAAPSPVRATMPQGEYPRAEQLAPAVASTPATIKRKTRTDDEEVAELERAVAQAEVDLRRKRTQIEDRKKDEARRAEEARVAAEREATRKLLVFQVEKGKSLSEAIAAYVGQNGWENLEWNVGSDFQVKQSYSERAAASEGMKEVLLKVLRPYGLSATLHRPNSVVEVFPAPESSTRN